MGRTDNSRELQADAKKITSIFTAAVRLKKGKSTAKRKRGKKYEGAKKERESF